MIRYQIYGLIIESEIEIEEAIEYESDQCEPDVRILVGTMPSEIVQMAGATNGGKNAIIPAREKLFFRVEHVAAYLIFADKILVECMEEASLSEIKTFLLGSALGYCMTLRQMVVLHGGCVASSDKGVIVTGESGAGKSTVCNALRERGFLFVSDDVCAISKDSSQVQMAYPQQKLCRDAALRMGYELSDLIYINEDRDKFALRLKDGYLKEGAKFCALYELVAEEVEEVSIVKVEGHEKLFTLLRNIYRGEFSRKMWGMPPMMMKRCTNLAKEIEVFKILRPMQGESLNQIVDFIEKQTR